MILYTTEFKKKNGELRTIKYVRPFDEPDVAFLTANVKGVKKQTLSEGFERVWDVEAQGFRVINHNELIKPIDAIGFATYDANTNTFTY